MASGDEKFSYSAMQQRMLLLESYFDEFSNAIKNIDEEIDLTVNLTANSSVYGDTGKKLKELWNNNCAIFANFRGIFNEWNKEIAEVYNLNISFESNLSGIDAQKAEIVYNASTLGNGSAAGLGVTSAMMLKALLAGYTTVGGDKIVGEDMGDGKQKIVVDGKEYIFEVDANGNLLSLKDVAANATRKYTTDSFEVQAQQMVNYLNNNQISQQEWDDYTSTLSNEQLKVLDYIKSGEYIIDDPAPTTDLLAGKDFSGDSPYTLEAGDKSADAIYREALAIQASLKQETETLETQKNAIANMKAKLESDYAADNTIMSETEYVEKQQNYEQQIVDTDFLINQREIAYEKIDDYTVNRWHWNDGDLRDSRDWWSNDTETAKKCVEDINTITSTVIPITSDNNE